jgi:hypothetical protein
MDLFSIVADPAIGDQQYAECAGRHAGRRHYARDHLCVPGDHRFTWQRHVLFSMTP